MIKAQYYSELTKKFYESEEAAIEAEKEELEARAQKEAKLKEEQELKKQEDATIEKMVAEIEEARKNYVTKVETLNAFLAEHNTNDLTLPSLLLHLLF